MSTKGIVRLAELLFLAILCAGSAHPAAPSLIDRADPFFSQVELARPTVAPGDEQTLAVTLDGPGATTTIFQLAVVYTNGVTQDVIDETVGSQATLSWVVPADAGVGAARFILSSSGCGCGDRSRPSSPINGESSAEGHFYVQ